MDRVRSKVYNFYTYGELWEILARQCVMEGCQSPTQNTSQPTVDQLATPLRM